MSSVVKIPNQMWSVDGYFSIPRTEPLSLRMCSSLVDHHHNHLGQTLLTLS
uniref:Uncharacterized protein n=1 Tax=Arion vulgaris TaxID=1028688 RepID=A0A0B6YBH0_9EUPU